MRRKIIGTMDFQGSVDITDPCYDKDIWCRMNNVKIRQGEYACVVWYEKDSYELDGENHTCKLVGIIGIYYLRQSRSSSGSATGEDFANSSRPSRACALPWSGVIPAQKSMERIGSIGVDAGLAGFFHNKPDFTDGEWSRFCDRIKNGDAWLNELGFFSSSGHGDGGYDVFAAKVNDEITALEIRFL